MGWALSIDPESCMRLTMTLAHFLWLGAAIGLLAGLVMLGLRRSSAQVRYGVLVLALCAMAVCPVVTYVVLPDVQAGRTVVDSVAIPVGPANLSAEPSSRADYVVDAANTSTNRLAVAKYTAPSVALKDILERPDASIESRAGLRANGRNWQKFAPYLAICYMIGVTTMLVRLLLGLYGGHRLRKATQPVADQQLLAKLSAKAKQIGLRFVPMLAYCREVAGPTVLGVFRPIILLPFSLAGGLSAEQMETILAHELAHIRRFDHLVNLLQRIIEALLFFHPAVWLISRQIRIERENCCDDVVVASGGQRVSYAESLIRVAELNLAHRARGRLVSAAALGAVGKPSRLRQRILRLLSMGEQKIGLTRTRFVGLIAVIVAAVLVIAFRSSLFDDSHSYSSPSGPNAIKLLGVRPDGGDIVYDAAGKEIDNIFGPAFSSKAVWRPDSQRRDFTFELSESDQPVLFQPFVRIRPSGTDRGLSSGQAHFFVRSSGKTLLSVHCTFPRAYRKPYLGFFQRSVPIEQIDLTISYYTGPRSKAKFSFTGPFIVANTVSADDGLAYKLTPKPNLPMEQGSAKFHLSTKLPFISGSTHGLAYDTSGKRHLVRGGSGRSGTSGAELEFMVAGVPLQQIAVITFGEKPQEDTFRNIVVAYPSGPVRNHAPYLDKMAKALGLTDLDPEKLSNYSFKNASEAIEVIDVVRGGHIRRASEAIRYARPRIDRTKLDLDVREKLRRTAKGWAKAIGPHIRVEGVAIGLWGKWPEFVEPALELVQLQNRSRGKAAQALSDYRKDLTPQQIDQITQMLLVRDDPLTYRSLLNCIRLNRENPAARQASWKLAESDKVWLWWAALERLATHSSIEERGSLSGELKLKIVAMGRGDVIPDRQRFEAQAQQLLPKLLTPKLRHMNLSVFSNVLQGVAERLDRDTATTTLIRFLQQLLDEWDIHHTEGRSTNNWWPVDRSVKYLNLWHGVNIGGLGNDISQQTPDEHRFDWQAVAAEAINWYDEIQPATEADKRKVISIEALLKDAPVSTRYRELEIFEQTPNVAGEYRIRPDVKRFQLPLRIEGRQPLYGEIFYLPDKDVYYIQYDSAWSSTRHYYGPFEGNPKDLDFQTADKVTFGPVIERTLYATPHDRDTFLDLETGKLLTQPEDTTPDDPTLSQYLNRKYKRTRWAKGSGADVMCYPYLERYGSEYVGLLGLDMAVVRSINQDAWSTMTPRQVADVIEGRIIYMEHRMLTRETFPDTFVLETREGSICVLQITGCTDKPRGVKIRYKVAQMPPGGWRPTPPLRIGLSPSEETVKSLTDLEVLASVWNLNQDAAKTGEWEIRRADNGKRVARIAYNWAIRPEQFLPDSKRITGRTNGGIKFALTTDQSQRIGPLGQGNYLMAWYVAGKRSSNVMQFRIDKDYDIKSEPLLKLKQIGPASQQYLPMLALRASRHTEEDPAPLLSEVTYPTLNVDGQDRTVGGGEWSGQNMPLKVGKHYTCILDLSRYSWLVEPREEKSIEQGKEHVIFAKVGQQTSNRITLNFDRSLSETWDRATAKLRPISLPATQPVENWGEPVEGLRVGISMKKTSFALDEPIAVQWQIENVSQQDKTIIWHKLQFSPVVFEISKSGEKKHIREDSRRMFNIAMPGPPEKIILKPGQTKEATFDLRRFGLDSSAKAGTYELAGLYSPKDSQRLGYWLKRDKYKDVVLSRVRSKQLKITLTDDLTWLERNLREGSFHGRLTAARRLAPKIGNKKVLDELERMYPPGNTRQMVWLVDHMAEFGDRSHVPEVLDMYEAGGYAPFWGDYGGDMLVFLLKWGQDRGAQYLSQYLAEHRDTADGTSEHSHKVHLLDALTKGSYWYFDFEISESALPLLILALEEKTTKGSMTLKSGREAKVRWCDSAALAIQKMLKHDWGFKLNLSEGERDEIINQMRAELAERVATSKLAAQPASGASRGTPGEPVAGLKCDAKPLKTRFTFGEKPRFKATLTNTSNRPLEIIGYAQYRDGAPTGLHVPCASVRVTFADGHYYQTGADSATKNPTAIRINPGKSWSFELPYQSEDANEVRPADPDSLPRIWWLLPGTYTAQVTYFIRDVEKELLSAKLVYGPEAGDLAGQRPQRLWEGITQSVPVKFEVLEDDSKQLAILKAIYAGKGLEHLRFEMTAAKTTVHAGQTTSLRLKVHNIGSQRVYIGGGPFSLREKGPRGQQLQGGGFGGGVRAIDPGQTLLRGGWNLGSGEPLVAGTYTMSAEYTGPGHKGKILAKSNELTVTVLDKATQPATGPANKGGLLEPSKNRHLKISGTIPVSKPHISFKHTRAVDTVLFSSDGKTLVSESFGDGIKISETLSGNLLRTLSLRGYGAANSIALSNDGTMLAVGTNRGTVRLFDTESLELQKTFPVTKWSIYAVAISPDGKMLASCGADGTVQLWDIESSKLLYHLGNKGGRMISMSFSGDSKFVAALSRTGRTSVWDAANGQLVGALHIKRISEIGSIAFCPDRKSVAIGAPDGIRFWDPRDGGQIRMIELPDSINPEKTITGSGPLNNSGPIYMGMTIISRDCKTAATAIEDGSIAVWDVQTRTVQQKLVGSGISDFPGGGIHTMAFSGDKRYLATGKKHGKDNGKVELWKLAKVSNVLTHEIQPAAVPVAKTTSASDYREMRNKAIEADKSGDVAKAMAAYKTLAEKFPNERRRYANFLAKQGKNDEAIKQYQAYYTDNPQRHHVLANISQLQASAGRFNEAVESREKFMVRAPSLDSGGRKELLALWGKFAKTAAASKHYLAITDNSRAASPRVVLAHLMLADIAFNAQDKVEARKQYWLALEQITPGKDTWAGYVHTVVLEELINRGWLNDAVRAYKKHPVPRLLPRLGSRLKREGRGQEMLNLYQEYLLARPGKHLDYAVEYAFYGGMGLTRLLIDEIVSVGQGSSSVEILRARIAEDPKSSRLHRTLGYLLYKMKQYEQALAEFEEAIRVSAKPSATLYEWIAGLCARAKLTEEAISYYEKALKTKITPEDLRSRIASSAMRMSEEQTKARFTAGLLESLGNLYRRNKQWTKAERCLLAIVELKPSVNTKRAQASLAEIWQEMGKENVILKQLKDRVAKEPDSAELRCEYAKSLLSAKRPADAAEQYTQALKLSPDDFTIRMELAGALAKSGQHEQAISQYETTLLGSIKSPPPRSKRGNSYAPEKVIRQLSELCKTTGQQEKLLQIYEKLLKLKTPEVKWTPSEHTLRTILRDMTEIMASRADYEAIVDLWVRHHEQVKYHSREAIRENAPRLNSLAPLIKRLQEISEKNRDDFQARLILGDVLILANRTEEAMAIYAELSKDAADNRRIHHDLTEVYQRMRQYDLAIAECQQVLSFHEAGSQDYNHTLKRIARLNLWKGDKAKAAEIYRKLIGYEPGNLEYYQGLNKATDGKEGILEKPTGTVQEPGETAAKRAQADQLAAKGQCADAITLYKEILSKRSTDVGTMVALAQTYKKAGQHTEALATFEKAHAMRKWSGTNYSASSELERIYRETKADDKLIQLFSDKRYYSGIRDLYRRRKQPEKFHQYLSNQLEQNPRDIELRFYLARSYIDSNEYPAAHVLFEELRQELTLGGDKPPRKSHALQLAKGLERIDQPKQALQIMELIDYENDRDGNDWSGTLLMRLYAKTGQFTKALDICALRLRKDANGYRTVAIAQEIASFAADCTDGPKLLDGFLRDIKGKIPDRYYNRFHGAVRAYRLAHPVEQSGGPGALLSKEDPVLLLREGRKIRAPQSARNLADFLDQLATQAHTVFVQSFRDKAARFPVPKIKRTKGPAFELLAEALNGKPISFEMTQEGYWAIFEAGDPQKKFICAANGGAICTLWEGRMYRHAGGSVQAVGRIRFEPTVQRQVVAIQSTMKVLEAIDDRGRHVSIGQRTKLRWDPSGQVMFSFGQQDPAVKSLATVKVETAVAICTRWATLTIPTLDHAEPISLQDDHVTVKIDPLRVADRNGRKIWQLPLSIRRNLGADAEKISSLRDEMWFVTADGKKLPRRSWSGSQKSANQAEIQVRVAIDAFDPASTSLVIREPAAIEIIPVVLTFHDIPIIDR